MLRTTNITFRDFIILDDPSELNDLAGDPAYADKVLELKQLLVDKISLGYVAPPPLSRDMRAATSTAETNPADPHGMKAWGLGWCPDADITVP